MNTETDVIDQLRSETVAIRSELERMRGVLFRHLGALEELAENPAYASLPINALIHDLIKSLLPPTESDPRHQSS